MLEETGAEPRRSYKEIAAEKREKHIERFRMYQDKANKKLYEKKSSCKLILVVYLNNYI